MPGLLPSFLTSTVATVATSGATLAATRCLAYARYSARLLSIPLVYFLIYARCDLCAISPALVQGLETCFFSELRGETERVLLKSSLYN